MHFWVDANYCKHNYKYLMTNYCKHNYKYLMTNCCKHNYKYLMTNRLNQDALKNLFSTIRNAGGNSDAPTCQIFKKLINGMISNHIFQSSVRTNCVDDAIPILQFMKMSDRQN